MQLLIDGKRDAHTSEAVPLKTHRFEITSWGEWKERYPDSNVYVGQETRE